MPRDDRRPRGRQVREPDHLDSVVALRTNAQKTLELLPRVEAEISLDVADRLRALVEGTAQGVEIDHKWPVKMDDEAASFYYIPFVSNESVCDGLGRARFIEPCRPTAHAVTASRGRLFATKRYAVVVAYTDADCASAVPVTSSVIETSVTFHELDLCVMHITPTHTFITYQRGKPIIKFSTVFTATTSDTSLL